MRYLAHTPADIARMLQTIGAPTVDALFAHIPEALRAKGALDLGPALDETSLINHLSELAAKNKPADGSSSFLGGGVTPHHVATAVDAQLQRAEWYTSYTPYQPEIAQGTLQAVFEFQTIVAEMLGLPVANASMYDGSTACAEAILMVGRIVGDHKKKSVLSQGLHPQYRETAETYLAGLTPAGTNLFLHAKLDDKTGRTDPASLEAALKAASGEVGCVVVQSPNYLGVVEDLATLSAIAHREGAQFVAVTTEPLAFGLLKPPGAVGADIAVGEGLGLAFAPSLGGPGVGMFASTTEHLRAMPGRLVGETVDSKGLRGWVLTLATREQHIRREKATSNICTNTGLMALAFTINMCLLGRRGYREMAQLSFSKAQYARAALTSLPGFSARYSGAVFNEFGVRVRGGKAASAIEALADRGIFAGVVPEGQDDTILVAVTERNRKEDIDRLAKGLDEVCA